jgi:cell division protein FtsB
MKKENTIRQMGKEKSKFDRDNTLIWLCCALMVLIGVQMWFTLQFKETIRKQEAKILKLEKSLEECSEAIYWEQDARKQDIIESNRRKNN